MDAAGIEFPVPEIDAIEHMFLELYLALVLMTIDITKLAPVAGQMGIILLAQAILMALFAIFVSFNVFGRDYGAAVMAAGMVPPLAVFVATLLFKDKFTEEERNSGLTNIVMGLSFITEGAIPFGAADPARAIPSFIVGSALTGALVGMAGIKLMAPHGGIFVIALTSNALLYLLFILIGAVVSGILFGFLRKPLDK